MNSPKVIIYGLVDTRNNQIFYVGSTCDLKSRMYIYLSGWGSSIAVRERTAEIVKSGASLKVRIFQAVDWEVRDEAESRWIRVCRANGAPLLNRNPPVFKHWRKRPSKTATFD